LVIRRKSIVFVRPYNYLPTATDSIFLGMLTRRQVVDASKAVTDADHLPAAQDLAGVLFDQSSRVRVAPDGRIFFSATEVSLPTTIADVPGSGMIFSLEPGRQATLTRVIPRGAAQNLGDAMQFFEFSPDMHYLSIPFSDGRVSILDIASGEARIVQPAGESDTQGNVRLATIPVWRNTDELTFARPMADGIHHEIVRYSLSTKTATVISSDWPANVLNLVNKPTTQPTTAPAGQ
jgi:hypothetical protein